MLSSKMTVSLMSLIIILALAFVAPSAMAQVEVTLSGKTSVPHGGTTASPDATTVDVVVATDKNVDTPTLTAMAFDKNGLPLYVDPRATSCVGCFCCSKHRYAKYRNEEVFYCHCYGSRIK